MLKFTTANKWNLSTRQITEYLWRVISPTYTHRCVRAMEMSYHKSYRGIYLKEVNQDKKKETEQATPGVSGIKWLGPVLLLFFWEVRKGQLPGALQAATGLIFSLSSDRDWRLLAPQSFSGIVPQCTDVSLCLNHNAPHHPLKNLRPQMRSLSGSGLSLEKRSSQRCLSRKHSNLTFCSWSFHFGFFL